MAWKVKKIESEWLDPASIVRSHLKVQLLFKPRPLPTTSCLGSCPPAAAAAAASSLVRLALNNNNNSNSNHVHSPPPPPIGGGCNYFMQPPMLPQLHCHIRAVAKPVPTPATAAALTQNCTPANIMCRVQNFIFIVSPIYISVE